MRRRPYLRIWKRLLNWSVHMGSPRRRTIGRLYCAIACRLEKRGTSRDEHPVRRVCQPEAGRAVSDEDRLKTSIASNLFNHGRKIQIPIGKMKGDHSIGLDHTSINSGAPG